MKPFFILGCPRSGTTLLRSIISSHSQVVIPREIGFFQFVKNDIDSGNEISTESGFRDFLIQFTSSRRFEYLEIDKNAFLSHQWEEFSYQTILNYLMHLLSLREKKRFWGEKTPGNEHYLNLIDSLYPSSKYIYILRDPRAVSASLKGVPWATDYCGIHIKLWKQSIDSLNRYKGSKKIMSVSFEDLIRTPESVTRQVCEFLKIEFEPSMVSERSKYQNIRGKSDWTTDYENKVSQPINISVVSDWRKKINRFEELMIQYRLRNYMLEFGYLQHRPLVNQFRKLQFFWSDVVYYFSVYFRKIFS